VCDRDSDGPAELRYVHAPTGLVCALVFIGRSGEPFPSGVEVHTVVDMVKTSRRGRRDNDLWAILEWMIADLPVDGRRSAANWAAVRVPPASPGS
jgi:hypothetical protein